METTKSLVMLLGRSNYEKIPESIAKRLDKVLEEANNKVADLKNRFNGSQKTIEKLRKDLQTSSIEKGNLEKLLSTSESSVTELRQQLNTSNAETRLLTERIQTEENRIEDLRRKRDDLVDENNQLKDICGRNDVVISQLRSDQTCCKQQFESEMFENDEGKKSIAEMQEREQLRLNNEEKLKTQIDQLKEEVGKLTDKCNEQAAELTLANQCRTTVVAQLTSDLKDKAEELNAANFTIRQLTESTQLSTSQRDGEAVQLKLKLNESATLIEHYKCELEAKIKLVDLHKANFDECQAQNASETMRLNQALKQTIEKFEMLESHLKDLTEQHQVQLSEMTTTIEQLKDELKSADETLKAAETERAENVLEKLFPRAATSNRMLSGNATLTEIFSRYHDSLDEVHRLEVECLHNHTKVECLTIELQETSSEFERQQIEFRKILKQNEEITQQVVAAVAEQESLREKLKENSERFALAESENDHLKSTQKDLARQICNLLNKVEASDNEPTSDQVQFKRLGLSSEAIRKELITFDNIVELQENNQKLMSKTRELSSRVAKLEEQNIKLQSCEQKISYLERQVSDAEAARVANENFLEMTTKQKERFKQLYYEAMNYMGLQTLSEEELMDYTPLSRSQSTASHSTADEKLLDVELKLQEKMKELKALKEQHNEYHRQSAINFDMLKQECESVERKVSELIAENSKLRSQENFASEQMKSHQNDIAIYKKQIKVLEERNQIYDKTIAKHELANNQLRKGYWNTIMQISKAESRCGYLEMECRRLTEANKNLDIENSVFHRQKMTQSILESSRELAKISSERSDFEGRIQMEQRLDSQTRQFEALKRKLDEEQIRFKEENESLKRQRDAAINKLSDEQATAESLRTKLFETRGQVEGKDQQNQSLSEKLQEALAAGSSAACLSKKARSSKDLQIELNNKNAEIEKLNLEIQELASKTKLFDRLKSNWEAEKIGLKSDFEACRLSESNSKAHINELQCEIRILLSKNSSVELENMKMENKKAAEKVAESHKQINELRRQCQQLKENLQIVETNYADVLSARSLDLQSVTSLRTELNGCQDQIQQLKLAKVEADEWKKKAQMEWEAKSKRLIDDRQELERKVEILEKQTLELVDLLQVQNMKPASDDPLSESVVNSSIMNRTFTDEEFENFPSDKIFGVVKYLRREKELAATQLEVLTIENTRLSAELDMLKNRVNELTGRLNSDSLTSSINNFELSAEYEELRRAAGTLNAVTDSNILLRSENQDLCHQVEDLAEKRARLEGELQMLQAENSALVESKAKLVQENKMLRGNVNKLKINEICLGRDLKQLTTEKERQATEELNSMRAELTAEKEKQQQATIAMNLMRADKARLEQDIETKCKHIETLDGHRKKLMQKVSKLEVALQEANGQLKLSQNEAKHFKSQCLGLRSENRNVSNNEPNPEVLKNVVTSTETVSPATTSLKKQPSGLKRPRDSEAVLPSSSSSAVEKVSPLSKRTRLQRGCENVASKSNVEENIDADNGETALDDEVALVPGAQQSMVDGNPTETGESESATVGDDLISEVESVDSGRVSADLAVDSEDFQLGRLRRICSRTEARRGRSRLNK
ncbi:hypothetical protein HA402_005620 [Bradysia odoriphaga]|nr:hypothetical protein HA402_005620 [Bradysia odoriphaga]